MKATQWYFLAITVTLLSGCATVQQGDVPATASVQTIEPAPDSLPLVLFDVPVGTEKSAVLEILALPGRIMGSSLTLSIADMDQVHEGKIYVNGQGPLDPPAGLLSSDSLRTADLEINPKWIKKGSNEIRFVFADNLYRSTKGFIVESVTLNLTFR